MCPNRYPSLLIEFPHGKNPWCPSSQQSSEALDFPRRQQNGKLGLFTNGYDSNLGDYIEFNLKSGHLKCFNGTNHLQSAYSSGMVFCSILKPIPKQFNYRQVLWCGISLAQDHVWTRNTAAVTLQSGRIRSRHSRYAAMPNGQAMNCILGKPFWTARSCHAPALRCRPWLKSVKPKRADVCCLKGAEMQKMFQKMFQHQFLKIIQIL